MTTTLDDNVFLDHVSHQGPSDALDSTITTTSTLSEADLNELNNYVSRPRTRSFYATTRPLVYITRRVPQRGLDVLLPTCNISQWDSEEQVPRGELLYNVQGVHGLLCMPSDRVDKELLDAAGDHLRAVATLSDDTRHIDVEECARRNIRVLCCPLPDFDGQADLTVALILLTLRTLAEGLHMDDVTHESSCALFSNPPSKKDVDVPAAWWNSLTLHKTFGVYGRTSLGLAVATRLRQLGARDIIVADFGPLPQQEFTSDFELVSRQDFLHRTDVVCVCDARASAQNEAVFDRAAFREMKTGAILIDSDSGHALDYHALYEALRDGEVCGAGLNTCNQTPVPYQQVLQGLRNCVFMPQTQEDRSDLRHKITAGVTTSLLNALKESIAEAL